MTDRVGDIRFEVNPDRRPTAHQVFDLFQAAGILSPKWSVKRLDRALEASSLIVCASAASDLVGLARIVTDFAWIGDLAQLAVKPGFQRRGIGARLIALAVQHMGDEVSLVTHAADEAIGFYEAEKFEPRTNVFRIERKK